MKKNKLDKMKNPALSFLEKIDEIEKIESNINSNRTHHDSLKETRISLLTYEYIKNDIKKIAKFKDLSVNALINQILSNYINEDENKKIILKSDVIRNL